MLTDINNTQPRVQWCTVCTHQRHAKLVVLEIGTCRAKKHLRQQGSLAIPKWSNLSIASPELQGKRPLPLVSCTWSLYWASKSSLFCHWKKTSQAPSTFWVYIVLLNRCCSTIRWKHPSSHPHRTCVVLLNQHTLVSDWSMWSFHLVVEQKTFGSAI